MRRAERRTSWRSEVRPLLVLLLLEILSFGVFLPRLGFYLDDWWFFDLFSHAKGSGLLSLIASFEPSTWAFRPLDALYHPALYWIGGRDPWFYHAALLVFEAGAGMLLFLALRSSTGDRRLSLLSAALFVVYPSHGASHFCSFIPMSPALFLVSAALLLHMVWVRRRSFPALAAGLACYLGGALTYEAVMPLFVLMPILSFWSRRRDGESPGGAARGAVRDSLPVLGAAVLVLLYQQVLVQRLFSGWIAQARTLALDPAFILKVLGRGFECTTTAVLHLGVVSLRSAIGRFGPLLWAGAAAASALLAWALRRELSGAKGADRKAPPSYWMPTSLLVIAACYLPYGFSAARYMPHIFDEQNRVNAPASVGGAMLLAWLLLSLPRWLDRRGVPSAMRRRRHAASGGVLAVLLAGSTLINWNTACEWSGSWDLQQRLLSGIAEQASSLPKTPAVFLLSGVPTHVGYAPVFNAQWVFYHALRVVTGREDLYGMVEGIPDPSPPPKGLPVFLYRFPEGALSPVESER